jgi:tetratricopeptide (TPR) repeat protein
MTVPGDETRIVTVPAIWGNVPQRNKNFAGRLDILNRLRQGTTSSVTAVLPGEPLPQALQGLGGVGKTAIAIEHAYRRRSDYDLVWWIPADQLPLVRASLAGLANRLGLQAGATTGIDGAAAAALDALRRGDPYSRWLLIFDNADQPEDILDLIPHGPGDVLITSRNHRWQAVIDTLPIDVFARGESVEFLAKRVPKGLTETDAESLAEKLGDLPLALEQAGAMLAETGMPVEEYLRLLDEQVTKIMSEGKSPDYPWSVTGAWMLSVSALREQLPQALELLRCCAFFGPEPIPRDVFRRSSLSTDTRVAEVISDPILLARAIRELGRFALVRIDGRTISVHRLIQALLRDELAPDEQALYRHEVHLLLTGAGPKRSSDERLWPRYRDLLPHVGSASTDLARCEHEAVRAFAMDVMRYLYVSGDLSSCLSLTDRFIKQWTSDSGPDSPDVLGAHRHLGNAVRLLGRYQESYRVTEAALASARATLGESAPLTLTLRNSFGADLRARGDFAQALALDEQTRPMLEAVYGSDDAVTIRLLASLALDYGLSSDYRRARQLYEEVYLLLSEASRETPANDLLGAWTGLAWAVRMTGNYPEARDVSEDAWEYGREALGPEHLATLRSANGVTIASRRIPASREDALVTARANLELAARVYGEGHPDTLSIAINVTNLQRTTGRIEEALELAEDTVTKYPAVYGDDHPYNYVCLANLAVLKRINGDAEAACELNAQILDGLDRRLSRGHHYPLTVAVNLASDLAATDRVAEARTLGEDTLPRLRALLGENHPSVVGSAVNLSLDRRAMGDRNGADALLNDSMARYEATLGTEHPDAIVAAQGGRLDLDFDPPPI